MTTDSRFISGHTGLLLEPNASTRQLLSRLQVGNTVDVGKSPDFKTTMTSYGR